MAVKIPTSEGEELYPPDYYIAEVEEGELLIKAKINSVMSSVRVRVSLTDARKLARWILKQEDNE